MAQGRRLAPVPVAWVHTRACSRNQDNRYDRAATRHERCPTWRPCRRAALLAIRIAPPWPITSGVYPSGGREEAAQAGEGVAGGLGAGVAGFAPVGLDAECAAVAVGAQGGDLAGVVHLAGTDARPAGEAGGGVHHRGVLHVHVHGVGQHGPVAVGVGHAAGDVVVAGIPDGAQPRVVHGCEDARRVVPGVAPAGAHVLQPEGHLVLVGDGRRGAQPGDDLRQQVIRDRTAPRFARRRVAHAHHGTAPKREQAHQSGPERARRPAAPPDLLQVLRHLGVPRHLRHRHLVEHHYLERGRIHRDHPHAFAGRHPPQLGHGVVGQLVHAPSRDLVELQVGKAHLARGR